MDRQSHSFLLGKAEAEIDRLRAAGINWGNGVIEPFDVETDAMYAPEWFVLHRNDKPYASRPDRAPLEEMVLKNPDFTEPQNGKLPTWEIVRYVPSYGRGDSLDDHAAPYGYEEPFL